MHHILFVKNLVDTEVIPFRYFVQDFTKCFPNFLGIMHVFLN